MRLKTTADATVSMTMKEGLKVTADAAVSMPMKEDLKTTADWNRGYADGKEDGEIFIVIKADREIDRSWFPFLYLLECDSCKSRVFP